MFALDITIFMPDSVAFTGLMICVLFFVLASLSVWNKNNTQLNDLWHNAGLQHLGKPLVGSVSCGFENKLLTSASAVM